MAEQGAYKATECIGRMKNSYMLQNEQEKWYLKNKKSARWYISASLKRINSEG